MEASLHNSRGRLAQLGERLVYTEEVVGSSPAPPMMKRVTSSAIGAALAVGAALLAAPVTAAPGDGVLLIGDSLGVGGEAYLEDELGGNALTTDAEIGRPSTVGVDVLASRISDAYGVVVFALGSNDDPRNPQTLASSLDQASEIVGGRCLVVPTVEVEGYTGLDDSPLNDVIRGFAAGKSNVRLVEWEQVATESPELLSDGGHATPEGYALRAQMIGEAIASCDGGAPAASAGGAPTGDGIPNPSPDYEPRGDELAEGETRPDLDRQGDSAEEEKPISREQALKVLADAVSSQIAIGALG